MRDEAMGKKKKENKMRLVFDPKKEKDDCEGDVLHKAVIKIGRAEPSAYVTAATFSMAADAIMHGVPIYLVRGV